ncbi:transcription initiation factor Spt5 [Tieghemostelium lacteum]|uniref:Transcription elongation factor SPT5 n=1 Tax=Tieghemostelium lacteum TaxID=361077 RepID=A0A151ZF66_TIELA|nr:transcription initiation factor Spt5 [Tieghemostelium lacteum]|eukprot:KYQ92608.1 transcription initiation factor Spt5 [Tieghemostelium lacteum]
MAKGSEDEFDEDDDVFPDEEDEEEEDYLDEDEEEEEEDRGRKKKKSKRERYISSLIEDEAEAGSEDDEYDEDDLIAEKDFVEPRENEDKEYSRGEHLNFHTNLQKTDEEIEEYIKQRAEIYMRDDEEDFDDNLPKQSYWRLKCRTGEERHFIAQMMQKMLNTQNYPLEERVLIKSIMAPQHLPGHIYVEAERETHVKQAIKGMTALLSFTPMLIPLKDIIEIISTSKKQLDLKRGTWIRVKLGKYKNDIGQVIGYDPAKSRVIVKIIPRIDFSEEDKKKNEDEEEEHQEDDLDKSKKKKKPEKRKRSRPQARFFNHDDVQKRFPQKITQRGNKTSGNIYYIFNNEKYQDGFLHKALRVSSIFTDGVQPTLEELAKFSQDKDSDKKRTYDSDDSDQSDSEDRQKSSTSTMLSTANLPQIAKKPITTFAKGDTVKVIEGDLKNLMGVVESVDENSITIMPIHEDINDLLLFKESELQKYFKIGDHVKVISGRYEGETGLVLRVEDITVVLLSDLTMTEVKVKIQDIQECSEISTGKLELGNYQLHDLVQTSNHKIGIIIKVERDSFKILDEHGNLNTVKLQEVGNKRRNVATALDAHGNTLNKGDMTEVVDGLYKGKQGNILQISRTFLFIKSKDVFENGGVFVVRSNYASLLGGNRNKQPGGSFNSPQNSFGNQNSNDSGFRGGRGGGGRGGGRGGRGGGRGGRDDSPLHKVVTIKTGNWKGYIGIVKECTDDWVQVELQTNSKKINLKKSDILLQNQRPQVDSNSLYLASKTPVYDPSMSVHGGSSSGASRYNSDPWSTRSMDTPQDYSSSTTPGTSYSAYSPYTPNTPSEIHRHDQYTPYDNHQRGTPNLGNMSTPSINSYDTPTPGYSHSQYDQPTPQSPYTPHNQPQTPQSPNIEEAEEEADSPIWKGINIEVVFTASSPVHVGKHALVLENTTETTCKLQLLDTKETVSNISQEHLELVPPAKKDRVVVVKGNYTGHEGTLFVLLGAIGVVKIDANLDFKVFKMSQLGKLLT